MADSHDPDDYWGWAINQFTGFPMPSRKTLFDTLKSKEGIPLFRGGAVEIGMRAVTASDYSAITGWGKQSGEDYDLAFYAAGGNGAHGGNVTLRQMRIVLIGVPDDANGRARLLDAGEGITGSKFSGHYGDDWDSSPLGQYISGAKAALDALIDGHKTTGVSASGASVADADAVDLDSFEKTAQAFDRVTQFFADHGQTLKDWETALGSEQAAWKGQAAGVFWNLIHTLNKNYASYVDQLGGPDYHAQNTTVGGYSAKSKFGDALAKAQQDLYAQAKKVRDAWTTWANSREHDPHRSVLELLDDLSQWVLANNVPYITEDVIYDSANVYYSTTGSFQQVHPEYGDLMDINSWKKLGEKAVARWNNYVDTMLVPTAKQSLSDLAGNWIDDGSDFEQKVTTKNTTSLTEQNDKDEADKEKADAEKEKADAEKELDDEKKKLNDALNGGGGGGGGGGGLNLDDLNKALNGGGGHDGLGGDDGLGGGDGADKDNIKTLNTDLNGGGADGGGGDGGGSDGGGSDESTITPDSVTSNLNDLLGGGADGGAGGGADGGTGGGTDGGAGGGGSSLPLNVGNSFSNVPNFGGQQNLNTNPLGSDGGTKDDGGPAGTHLDLNGNLVKNLPDGSQLTFDPDTGQLTTTGPDGTQTQTHLDPGDTIDTPDGGHVQLNPDGSLDITSPDHTQQHFDPSTHTLQTTDPDGATSTTHLNPGDLGDLGDLGDGPSSLDVPPPLDLSGGHSHLTDASTLNHIGHDLGSQLNSGAPGGLGGGGRLGGGTSNLNGGTSRLGGSGTDLSLGDEFADYDGDPLNGGALGGPAGPAGPGAPAAPASGTPLNGPMGGGGGGMGGGAGGGNSSSGERVRSVLGESGGASLRRTAPRRSAAEGEDVLLSRGGPATSSSGSPVYGGGGGQNGASPVSTESSDRERASWLAQEEDEDVWGEDEGSAPAVIG